MSTVLVSGAEAAELQRSLDAEFERDKAWLRSKGAKSFEAAVVVDPPVSDVDVD